MNVVATVQKRLINGIFRKGRQCHQFPTILHEHVAETRVAQHADSPAQPALHPRQAKGHKNEEAECQHSASFAKHM